MAREFPLVRTYQNLVWNLKHYRPPSQRPPFRSSRHPFCTNIQLQNASCAFWLKETSKELGTRVSSLIAQSAKASKSQIARSGATQLASSHSSEYLEYSREAAANSADNTSEQNEKEVNPAEIEIVRLFSAGEYTEMYRLLKSYKEQGITIPAEIITEMVASVQEQMPTDTSQEYLHQSVVEVPMFYGKNHLQYISMYGKMYSHISTFYDVCKLYENEGLADIKFAEKYIWLCYHMDDIASLQRLLYTYLKNPTYDTRTLSYMVSAFIYNYDVEFSNSLLNSIIAMGRPLDDNLISSVVLGYVRVGAVFTKIVDLVQLWSAPNCESPYPKTVAMLLKQYYKYGTDAEIAAMEAYTEKLGYNNNFLVNMVKIQEQLVKRESQGPLQLNRSDTESILAVRDSIKHSKYALKVFYESNLLFLSKHTSMGNMQQLLREMKNDGLPFTKFSYNVIVQHYVLTGKFVPLLKFMQKFVTHANRFEIGYVKQLFDAFVRTYPFEAEHFFEQFQVWLDSSELPSHTKKVLTEACKVTQYRSSVFPVGVDRHPFADHKKYLAPQWTPILHNNSAVDRYRKQEQVSFRLDRGFRDIMRKGIKPDYHVVESTLRNLNPTHRMAIFECLREMRMTRFINRLEIFDFLMSRPEKAEIERFVTEREARLTTSDKILLTRTLCNKKSSALASRLLDSLDDNLSDSRRMFALNLRLRNTIDLNDFEGCINSIESFPINDTTLSPYIQKQCRYIEKRLTRLISALEVKKDFSLDLLEQMNVALQKLQGLIGDIEARLKSDKVDIQGLVGEMFQMLNEWIRTTRNQDPTKI